jgi:hypothetical protein
MATTKLTIYSQSGHLVQRFSPETTSITLPKSAEIESIVVIDIEGRIIPFSYLPPTSIGSSLTDRQTGEKVDVTVSKNNQNITGKIITIDSDNVTLLQSSQITTIREYDQIMVNLSGPNNDITQPRLIVETTQPFTVSYLVSNIMWNCIGTILIDQKLNQMHLRLAGNINNTTESNISAVTTLVSGEVHQHRQHSEAKMFMARAPMPMSSPPVNTNRLEDYTRYEIGDRLIRNTNIIELGTFNYPIHKIYVHQTNEKNRVQFGYHFTATEFIPSCSVNVYSMKDGSIDSYLGSNQIPESQSNDEIDLLLGESTILQCKSLIVVSDVTVKDEATLNKLNQAMGDIPYIKDDSSKAWHIITEDLTVDITNRNPDSVILVIKHLIENKLIINIECQAFKQRKDGFIEWYFQIPPQSGDVTRKETFKCKIVTAGFY